MKPIWIQRIFRDLCNGIKRSWKNIRAREIIKNIRKSSFSDVFKIHFQCVQRIRLDVLIQNLVLDLDLGSWLLRKPAFCGFNPQNVVLGMLRYQGLFIRGMGTFGVIQHVSPISPHQVLSKSVHKRVSYSVLKIRFCCFYVKNDKFCLLRYQASVIRGIKTRDVVSYVSSTFPHQK